MEGKQFNNEEIIEDEELILLILYYSENYNTLKTRLIKLLFVFHKIFPINDDFDLDLDFFPYNYGPSIKYEDYELMIATLKNYNTIEVEKKEVKNYTMERIKIREKNRNEIIEMIKNKLIPEKPEYKIELIETICKLFPNYENSVLMQFVYYIKQDFTIQSIIKEDIFNRPKKALQNKVIEILKELRVRYIIIFLNSKNEILNIINITSNESDFSVFFHLIEIFQESLRNNCLTISKDIIQMLDNMSLEDKKYHKLKIALLDLFLKNLDDDWDNEIIISVFIYILKALCFDWSLDSPDDRSEFISITSKLYHDNKYFYSPEDKFSVLEKKSAMEEDIHRLGLDLEKDLILPSEENEENIEDPFDLIEEI